MKKLLLKTVGTGLNTLAHIAPRKTARLGFELFCRPFRTTITKKHNNFFDTATKKTFQHEDNVIQTYRWGSGKKSILLLHGWQSHSYRWKAYVEALREEYTVYALDAPGHGLSSGKMLNVPLYGDVIKKFLTDVGGVDAILAHSLGGFAAFYVFHHHTDLTAKKIVALASPGEAQEFFDFFTRAVKLSPKTIALIRDYFTQLFQQPPSYFSSVAFASTLTIPGLIIHDADDKETPFHHAERINKSWKNSRLIKTQGLGHNLKSHDVLKAVLHFLNDKDYNYDTTAQLHHTNHH
jgi:pimeloyl-ACP methyl ester carboxylesterase